MATPPISIIFLSLFLFLYASLLTSETGLGVHVQARHTTAVLSPTLHTVHIASLLPSTLCTPSPKGPLSLKALFNSLYSLSFTSFDRTNKMGVRNTIFSSLLLDCFSLFYLILYYLDYG